MQVTITGGTGNVAEYLIKELEGRFDLVLFDRVPPGQNRFQYDIHHPVVVGELMSVDDCERAVKDSDAIIHLGAIPYPTELPRPPSQPATGPVLPFDETMKVNTMGTYYVMEAARRQGVKVVVTAISNCVLGHLEAWRPSGTPFPITSLPLDEEHPTDVEDSYSLSKQFQEQIMHALCAWRLAWPAISRRSTTTTSTIPIPGRWRIPQPWSPACGQISAI